MNFQIKFLSYTIHTDHSDAPLTKLAASKGVIITSAEAHEKVENMVDEGYLIKVEYKGNFTYKDALKWKKGKVSGHIINSDRLSAKLQWAVACIGEIHCDVLRTGENADVTDSNNSEPRKGATPEEIEEWFKSCNDPKYSCVLRKGAMFDVLTREVEMHRLQKSHEDGSYFVGQVKVELMPPNTEQSQTVKISPSTTTVKRSREKSTTNDYQIKPTDIPVVKHIQEQSVADANENDGCQRPRPKRKIKSKFHEDSIYAVTPIKKVKLKESVVGSSTLKATSGEKQITCKTHQRDDDTSESVSKSSGLDVKHCEDSLSSTKQSVDLLQPLTPAEEWIHIHTHLEKLPLMNGDGHDDSQSEQEAAAQQTLPLSPVTSASNSTDSLNLKLNSVQQHFSICDKCHQIIKPPRGLNECDGFDFPDMTDFTAEEVYSYMKTFAGGKYEAQAQVLKDEDIDGNALMILSRADILRLQDQGKLLLGPALKLNHLIKNIKLKGCAQYYKHD